MYVKPEVTRYSGKELLDLMGPVETAYCDIEAEGQGCEQWLRVSYSDRSAAFKDGFDWRVLTDEAGQCSDPSQNEGEFPDSYDRCFGGIDEAGNELTMPVQVCCLMDNCDTSDEETWTIELTFFHKDGSEATCTAMLDVQEL